MPLWFPLFAACLFSSSDHILFPTASPSLLNPGGQRAEISCFQKEKEASAAWLRPCDSLVTLSKSPFVPPHVISAASWSVAHLPHALGVLTEDQGLWVVRMQERPSLTWEQLLKDPGEAGASHRSSLSHKLGKVIPLASSCPLTYLGFDSSSRPLGVSYFAWRTKTVPTSSSLPNTRADAPCKARDPQLIKWLSFPHYETWIRSAENHGGIIKDTCRW